MSAYAVTFHVTGAPTAQGSMRAFNNRVVQGGTADSRRRLGDWRHAIAAGAAAATDGRTDLPWDEPVEVALHFALPKPKSIPKFRRWAWRKPDLDKLARSALDAMEKVIWTDDARVVVLNATKRYAEGTPGVTVTVRMAAEVDA